MDSNTPLNNNEEIIVENIALNNGEITINGDGPLCWLLGHSYSSIAGFNGNPKFHPFSSTPPYCMEYKYDNYACTRAFCTASYDDVYDVSRMNCHPPR